MLSFGRECGPLERSGDGLDTGPMQRQLAGVMGLESAREDGDAESVIDGDEDKLRIG